MNEITTNYLQSYTDYYWQYEDQGKVIAVPDGHTLGYSDLFINEILVFLAPQGLPRFGSLLLVFAATNAHSEDTLDDILTIVDLNTAYNKDVSAIHEDVIKGTMFLKILKDLPNQYKKRKGRLELVRAIFAKSHNSIGKKMSQGILEQITHNPSIHHFPDALNKVNLSDNNILSHIQSDFKVLALLGKELKNVDDVINLITNIPEVNDLEIEENTTHDTSEKPLLEQLEENPKTFHCGVLVSRLISGLSISLHTSVPSEQPMGGVSDITTKGELDKLLISEYSYDNDVLMSRLANNESLYHHREIPPSDNKYNKTILIDISLKNWGTIKSISYAVMLAITNHPKNDNPCSVFLVGNSYKKITFNTVNDIIESMQILDVSLDPGIGLTKLFNEQKIEQSEVFYIGSMDCFDQNGMRQFNSDYGSQINHWIHPDELGKVSVYKNQKRGKRFVQELKLPLSELWSKTKKADYIPVQTDFEYPILFPYSKTKDVWSGDVYTYVTTKKHALLRNYRSISDLLQPWEMISLNFKRSYNIKAVVTHEDLSVSVLVIEQHKDYYIINYPSGKITQVELSRLIKPKNTFRVENGLFKSKNYAIDTDGNVIEEDDSETIKANYYSYRYNNIYINIKSIDITKENALRIGKQVLTLRNNHLSLMHDGNKYKSLISATLKEDQFVFPDGSLIQHNKNGMLTLISSDESIPKIYIPAVLDIALGVATESDFAGNLDYRMDSVIILEDNEKMVTVTKFVSTYLVIPLKEANKMIENKIISVADDEKMIALSQALKEHNIPHKFREAKQRKILIKEFYDGYIQLFINQIISYGTFTN